MPRRILPVPSSFPLARLIALCRVAEPLGVWLEAARPPVRLVVPGLGGRRLILIASDLGTLLAGTSRVAVWDGCSLRTIAPRVLGRARQLDLGAHVASVEALRIIWAEGSLAERDVSLRQPVDCVMEGPVA